MLKNALFALVSLGIMHGAQAADKRDNPLKPSETWDEMRVDVVGDREILDGSAFLEIDAPYRAHDAATVPITIRETADSDKDFVKLTFIVDENPAPIAAEFEFGPSYGDLDMETRMRVNAYSNVRALAETKDGEIYMVGKYVKASGGCSAPAMKDADAANAGIGKMKLRFFDPIEDAPKASGTRREAQVMVRHPNYSGLQMNQLTQLFIPAYFVDEIEVMQGDQLVMKMTGGISISEDPSFRFKYIENGAGKLTVKAKDTDGEVYEREFATATES